jgi:TetR/AcrR family transcriptional regulator, transcriptional repressor for nem operon
MALETRRALIDAASELFAAQGLEVSLDAICEHAGVTRGALYVHFKDRNALIVAVMELLGDSFTQALSDAVEVPFDRGRGSRFGALTRRFTTEVLTGRYPLMAPRPGQARFKPHQLLEACARSALVRDYYQLLVASGRDFISAALQEDQKHGLVRKDVDADQAAMLVATVVTGSQVLADLGLQVDVLQLQRTLTRLLTVVRTS